MEIPQIKKLVKAINDKELQIPILLIGATGIGKSYSMKELAKENEIGFIDLRLATQEVTDLVGIPRTIEKDGEYRTYWTKPIWFPKEGTKGILALEEVNRAPEDVRQAIFQLLTEWKLHTHELPKGWSIVSLINPDNGAYHVNQLDPAFKRRFVQIVLNPPDITDWCVWAKKNNVDDKVIRFVAQFPKLLSKNDNITIEAYPTPAGHHMLATLLAHNAIPENCLHEVASGIVGPEAATTFIQTLKRDFEKPITAKEIFDDYSKIKDKYKKLVKERRNDLLYVTMVDIIADCEIKKLGTEEVKGLHEYLLDSMPETLTTVVLRLNESILTKLSKFEDLVDKIIEIKKNISDV